MSNTKVSDLTSTTPDTTDILYVVDGGNSRQTTISNLITGAGLVTLTDTQTLTNKTIDLGSNTLTGSLAEFNTALQSDSFVSLTGTETLTNKTLTAPKFADEGFIADANGNEILVFNSNSSAVNQVEVFNRAAGSAVGLNATGDDTDIDFEINPQGTGDFRLGSGDINLLSAGSNIQVGSADPTRGIYIPALGMFAATTSGAASGQLETSSNKNNMKYFAFDQSSDEYVHFTMPSPLNWDAGTITAQFYWTTEAGGSAETVDWGIQGVATANDDTLDVAYGTPVTVTDTWIADDDQHISSVTSAVTIAGSPAAGEWIDLRIFRDTSEDDLGGDAWLLGVRIAFTISKYNDA